MALGQRVSTCKLADVSDLLTMWNKEGWVAVSVSTWVAAATSSAEAHGRVSTLFQRAAAGD